MTKIYVILNNINSKVYVGKTKRTLAQRWASHVQSANKGKDIYFYRAIRKYSPASFSIDLIVEVEDNLADYTERFWIHKFGSTDPELGYNGTIGGEGGEQTEEIKKKIGEASRALWRTPDYREKVSKSLKGLMAGENNPMFGRHEDHPWFGKTHSDDTKQKISDTRKELYRDPDFKQKMIIANTGKHHTEEGRANIAKALKGNQYRKGIPHSPEIKARIAESVKRAYTEGRKKRTGGLKKVEYVPGEFERPFTPLSERETVSDFDKAYPW